MRLLVAGCVLLSVLVPSAAHADEVAYGPPAAGPGVIVRPLRFRLGFQLGGPGFAQIMLRWYPLRRVFFEGGGAAIQHGGANATLGIGAEVWMKGPLAFHVAGGIGGAVEFAPYDCDPADPCEDVRRHYAHLRIGGIVALGVTRRHSIAFDVAGWLGRRRDGPWGDPTSEGLFVRLMPGIGYYYNF